MKALFLGHFAAGVAPRILAKVKTPLESSTLDDEGDAAQLAPLLAEAEIVVGHIWRAGGRGLDERNNRPGLLCLSTGETCDRARRIA